MALSLAFLQLVLVLASCLCTRTLTLRNPVQALMLGKFDNLQQATRDLGAGKPTAATGGHEHVTASITQHPHLDSVLLAQYYLEQDESKTFRYRCYEFVQDELERADKRGDDLTPLTCTYTMRLYRPLPAAEAILRSCSYDISSPAVQESLPFFSESVPASDSVASSSHVQAQLVRDFEYLDGCDVLWTPSPFLSSSTSRSVLARLVDWLASALGGSFQKPSSSSPSYRGVLAQGSCRVCSQSDPTLQLVIRDDLGLFPDRLEINDRVYTLEGKLLIGNSEGVPYVLDRQ